MRKFIILLVVIVIGIVWKTHIPYYKGPVSNHFDGLRFYDPIHRNPKGFWSFLRWRLTSNKSAWPTHLPLKFVDTPPQKVEGPRWRVSYIGHCSVLIQTQGINILLDPIYSSRASPVSWAGPHRAIPPGLPWDALPPIDVVLVTHCHYDHLDGPTLKKLWDRFQPRIIAPLGDDVIMQRFGKEINVETYDWNDTLSLTDEISATLVPVQHWSKRGLFDRNLALWSAFVIQTKAGNIFYCADAGYGQGEHLRAAYKTYGPFRLAFLPIGDYEPKWFMGYGHMPPEEVVLAHRDLGQPPLIALHHGVFSLGDVPYGQAAQKISEAFASEKVPANLLFILEPGQTWTN